MKNLERKQKCTMYNVQCTTNDNNQNRLSLRGDEVGVAIRCRCSSSVIPEIAIPVISSERSDERSAVCSVDVNKTPLSRAAFTLVELVITIAIVIILSVISVPIYRGYVDKAKMSEGYALLGTILSAQKSYYSENGNFYSHSGWTQYDPVLGIDVRGNKYFTRFHLSSDNNVKYSFYAGAGKPEELYYNEHGGSNSVYHVLYLQYNSTRGVRFLNGWWDGSWCDVA